MDETRLQEKIERVFKEAIQDVVISCDDKNALLERYNEINRIETLKKRLFSVLLEEEAEGENDETKRHKKTRNPLKVPNRVKCNLEFHRLRELTEKKGGNVRDLCDKYLNWTVHPSLQQLHLAIDLVRNTDLPSSEIFKRVMGLCKENKMKRLMQNAPHKMKLLSSS